MEYVGYLLIFVSVAFIAYVVVIWGLTHPKSGWGKLVTDIYPFPRPQWIANRLEKQQTSVHQSFEEATAVVDAEDIVRTTKAGSFIEVLGRQFQYTAKMTFLELQFFGGNKKNMVHNESLRKFAAVELSGNQLLLEQPEFEGGQLLFFLYENRTSEMPRGFNNELKGTNSKPGPIVRFVKSDQRGHIEFSVLDKTWVMQDIVWVDVKAEGGKGFVRGRSGAMPRLAMLLSKNRDDSNEWLLFANIRSGRGSDTLWVGRKFDIEMEVDV